MADNSSLFKFKDILEALETFPMAEFLEAIRYPSFEPIKMRQLLRTKLSVEDLIFLCYVGLRMGNNTRRIVSSTRCTAARRRLVLLINRLGIKDKAMDNPKVITLSRVMASFPELTLRVLHVKNPPMLIPHSELKTIHEDFPSVARTPVAASILPYGLTKGEVQQALTLIAVPSLKASEVLSVRNTKWVAMSREEKAKTTLEYVLRCFNANVISKELRISKASEFGMVEHKEGALTLTPAWQAAGAAAIAWLKSDYDVNSTIYLGLGFKMLINSVK